MPLHEQVEGEGALPARVTDCDVRGGDLNPERLVKQLDDPVHHHGEERSV